jgi:hypothetical protein
VPQSPWKRSTARLEAVPLQGSSRRFQHFLHALKADGRCNPLGCGVVIASRRNFLPLPSIGWSRPASIPI